MTDPEAYGDWRSLELAMKEAARKAAKTAGPGISAAKVDAQIRQARFDRFLSRVFAQGEESEWMLKGGMSMLARVPRSRTTKDMDLAAQDAADMAAAERALVALVDTDLGDHLTFRLIRSAPTGLGDNQPGVVTRRLLFACVDIDHDTQIDTMTVDVVVGPPPIGSPEIVEPANRLRLRRPLTTHPYRLYPVVDQIADKVCATMDNNYPGLKASSRVKDLVDLVVLLTPRPPTSPSSTLRSRPNEHSATSIASTTFTSRPAGTAPTQRLRRVYPSRRVSPPKTPPRSSLRSSIRR